MSQQVVAWGKKGTAGLGSLQKFQILVPTGFALPEVSFGFRAHSSALRWNLKRGPTKTTVLEGSMLFGGSAGSMVHRLR